MRLSEISDRVDRLQASSPEADPESAHVEEDGIHVSVLQAIMHDEIDNPAEAARLALKTKEISFDRWYA